MKKNLSNDRVKEAYQEIEFIIKHQTICDLIIKKLNNNTIPNQQASNAQNVTQPVQQPMNYQIVQPMNQGTQNVAPMANNAIPSVQQPVTFQNKSTQINGNISQ